MRSASFSSPTPRRRAGSSVHLWDSAPVPSRLQSPRSLLLIALVVIACVLATARLSSSDALSYARSDITMPNFDFDFLRSTRTQEAPEEEEEEDYDPQEPEETEGADGADPQGGSFDRDGGEDELPEDVLEEDADTLPVLHSPPSPAYLHSHQPPSFLPYSCASTRPLPTYAKYALNGTSPTFDPAILDRSVLFPGTGSEVQRILARAVKSSLYGAKRLRERAVAESARVAMEDEEPFRILVLGGSVSNCRGVDPWKTCWHSHILRWFQRTLPMESDPPLPPSALSRTLTGPLRLNDRAATPTPLSQRSVEFLQVDPSSDLADLAKRAFLPTSTPPRSKRALSKKKKKVVKKKKKGVTIPKWPSSRLVNVAKSATGSAFFAYCYKEHMELRGKDTPALIGNGPDLVVLEFGVNDVWPQTETATRDFEKLLRTLRTLPSSPAIVILEAASLLLAQTSSFTTNAEYLHLPAAQFYDIPILSAKQSLFGPTPGILPSSTTKMEDLFLPDLHHPNERGHELLADILISYLEKQSCLVQAAIKRKATTRIAQSGGPAMIVPELDVRSRKDEGVLALPFRSLFDHYSSATTSNAFVLPPPTCIQLGNSRTTIDPARNSGWTKFAWARDKEYLAADKPGSVVTFDVVVGQGGEILVDFLRSRFYDLGNVLVYIDGKKSQGEVIAGWWDLGWSIGVPHKAFSGISAGPHTVSFELLPGSQSSHPSRKTHFRLIGLITT